MLNFPGGPKNIVLSYVRDRSGCSHYRHRFGNVILNALEFENVENIICSTPIFDESILARTRAIICQRFVTKPDEELIKRYKALQPKFGYSLIFEVDDMCFSINGKGIPEYNSASENFNKNIGIFDEVLTKTLPMYDRIVVSTDFLKYVMEQKFGVHNIFVMKNTVPRYLWSYPRKSNKDKKLVRPRVLYSGSPCHYLQPQQGKAPLKGDWGNAWCDWVIKNVREGKIDFVCMGALPWFFEEIRNMITVIPWVDCMSYPRAVQEINADFQLAPLADNDFNRCKSALRLYESCAAGTVMLGTVFPCSPYLEANIDCQFASNVSVNEIDERFAKLCESDNYNRILNWQYDFVNAGRWMESQTHINELLSILDGPQQPLI